MTDRPITDPPRPAAAEADAYEVRYTAEPWACRGCHRPTHRQEHRFTDGTVESGPYSWWEAWCQSCNAKIAALCEQIPPCTWCGDETDRSDCCEEMADYTAWLASDDEVIL